MIKFKKVKLDLKNWSQNKNSFTMPELLENMPGGKEVSIVFQTPIYWLDRSQILQLKLKTQVMKPTKYFAQVVNQFEHKYDPQTACKEIGQEFLLHPFKINKFSTRKLTNRYKLLTKRYKSKQISVWEEDWHKNQRKIFIEFLICFCKINNTLPSNLTQAQWENLSVIFFQKKIVFLKFQGLSIQKKSNKVIWTKNDDKLIRASVEANGEKNWNQISKKLFYLTNFVKYFSPKKIRERWFNHLSQNVNHGPWSKQEDLLILEHVENENKHWCEIVKLLNHTRTQHMVKNRYQYLIKPQKGWRFQQEIKIVTLALNDLRKRVKRAKNEEKPKMEQSLLDKMPVTQQKLEQINNQAGEEIVLKDDAIKNSLEETKKMEEEEGRKQNYTYLDNFIFDPISFGIFFPDPYASYTIPAQNQEMMASVSLSSMKQISYFPPILIPAGDICQQIPHYPITQYCEPMITHLYQPGQPTSEQERTSIEE